MGKGSICQAAAAALLAVAALSFQPVEARAAAVPPQTEASTQGEEVTPVWFGNGCFWVCMLTALNHAPLSLNAWLSRWA